MSLQMKDGWDFPVTLVADAFIDEYMAAANGEYVKVYLYFLRHRREEVTVDAVAEALGHTEADVRRALAYWEKKGVLRAEEGASAQRGERVQEHGSCPAPQKAETAAFVRLSSASSQVPGAPQSQVSKTASGPACAAGENAPQAPSYSAEQVNRLSGDEEFSQLLYIAQKYLSKVFTPRDCQVFAYLYDSLKMSTELLEYLVEYCAQNGHSSIRYLETVALNWHSRRIRTPEEAKAFADGFNRDSFSVMRAFGLGDRRPGTAEQKLIEKWFKEYGFDRELVLMACNRTISAIHSPSFQYADRILTDWKNAGVRVKADVEALDEKRAAKAQGAGGSQGSRTAAKAVPQPPKKAQNQFHNFKQRDTDYDALVLKQLKERVGRP